MTRARTRTGPSEGGVLLMHRRRRNVIFLISIFSLATACRCPTRRGAAFGRSPAVDR